MRLLTTSLSIRQPWAWLIVNGYKDIENRSWKTNYRGPVLIHAGKAWDRDTADDMLRGDDPAGRLDSDESMIERFVAEYPDIEANMGGIVVVADVIGCVEGSRSPWFFGPYGFELDNARPLPFTPMKGALGFFKTTYMELTP